MCRTSASAGRDYDELSAVDFVSHGRACGGGVKRCFPDGFSGFLVDGFEVGFVCSTYGNEEE